MGAFDHQQGWGSPPNLDQSLVLRLEAIASSFGIWSGGGGQLRLYNIGLEFIV